MLVDLDRRADLLDAALVEHGDAIGHRQCLVLIVGDEDEGDADLALDLLELDLHLLAQFQVECAEGLIEEQHLRAVHERPRERDPLTLAAGERRGRPVAEILKTDVGQGLARPLGSLGLRDLLHA